MKKIVIPVVWILSLVMVALVFSPASSGTETLQKIIAAINHEIKVTLDGEVFKPVEEDGTQLKPIIYNGRTYLPLKAVATALDVYVDWDPDSKTVIMITDADAMGIPYKDDEDIVKPVEVSTPAPQVTALATDGKVKISWNKIDSSNFNGYKVVVSQSNPTPAYPADGYATYITDPNKTYYYLDASSGYNGGDFGGKFISGQLYYFSVTALYDQGKVPGNVIQVKMP